MAEISIRELRNHGGDVVDRAQQGEQLTITRSGRAVAQLGPMSASPVSLEVLIERRQHLPDVDPTLLRADIDAMIDADL